MINWQQLKADLGGKWFLERKSLLALLPFLIATSVLSASSVSYEIDAIDPDPLSRYLKLILANLVSLTICWLYLEIAGATIFARRFQKPVAVTWVILFGASLGLVKGLTTGYFSFLFGSELILEMAIVNRIIRTTLLGAWTVPLVALAAATYFKYKSEREILLAERVEATLRAAGPAKSEKIKVLSSFVASSKQKITALREQADSNTEASQIAKDLRVLIENWLRPLSHSIWDQEQGLGRQTSGLTIYALGKNPFPLLIIGAGFLIGLLPINLTSFQLSEALLRTVFTILIALAVYALFKVIPAKESWQIVLLFVVGNLLASATAYFLTELIFGAYIDVDRIFSWIALFLWLGQLSFFGSVVTEVVKTRSEIRRQLSELIGETGLDSEALVAIGKLNNRELAQYVHSNLQNRLLAKAIKLETDNLTATEVKRQLEEVEEILDRAVSDFESSSSLSFESQLQELISRWKGFLEITFKSDTQIDALPNQIQRTLLQLVNEAISNSQRHGLASNIAIEIVAGNGELTLHVSDDGLGPRSGRAGLGTELFSAVGGNHWSLEPSADGGSHLKIRIRTAG